MNSSCYELFKESVYQMRYQMISFHFWEPKLLEYLVDCEIFYLLIPNIDEDTIKLFKNIEARYLLLSDKPKCCIDELLNNPNIQNIRTTNKEVLKVTN